MATIEEQRDALIAKIHRMQKRGKNVDGQIRALAVLLTGAQNRHLRTMAKTATALPRFVPRVISAESAALGYNNAGRGKLIGYVLDPKQHEISCPHYKDINKTCACRIGLWQGLPPVRKKRSPKPKAKIAKRKRSLTDHY